MKKIILQPGDFFCSRNPMMFGKSINFFQKYHSKDKKSKHSHAGIILDQYGKTFEVLWTVKHSSINEYSGKEVLIGRNKYMTKKRFNKGYAAIKPHLGRIYPFHRFIFFALGPRFAKFAFGEKFLVCSEETLYFKAKAGLGGNYRGRTPDNIADEIRYNPWIWDIVYDGVLEV